MATTDQNLGLDIVRVTEAAALASSRWFGRGNKKAGDQAAVNAMRLSFNLVPIIGTIIIGEGAKDEAPMLFNGEAVGNGTGPTMEVAVDPLEGTNLLAFGQPNAISVVGLAPAGAMYNPGPSYYMQKLVVPDLARNAVDLDAPVADNIRRVAKALGKNIEDLIIFVLDKPRHKYLVEAIQAAGARSQLHTDGDVNGSLMTVDPLCKVDMMLGTGGTPEGVLSACAIRGMGGCMLARLDPQSEAEKQAIIEAGMDLQEILTEATLIKSENVFFAATGISDGIFLQGVVYNDFGATTHSLVIRGKTGTMRSIFSRHSWNKLIRNSEAKHH
ncbi:Fructose-1,6-bisphosphatase class 2 [Desulfovibrionales bacterium]